MHNVSIQMYPEKLVAGTVDSTDNAEFVTGRYWLLLNQTLPVLGGEPHKYEIALYWHSKLSKETARN